MVKHYLIGLFCTWILTLSVDAQQNRFIKVDHDYEKFANRLENEIEAFKQRHGGEQAQAKVISPDILPPWLLEPLVTENSGLHFIGISDPGMDSISAYQQALLRANIMAALTHKSSIGFIADNFNKENTGRFESISGLFVRFFQIINKVPFDATPDVVQKDTTGFGETILLINGPEQKEISDSLTVVIEGMLQEKASGERMDISYKFSISSGIDTDNGLMSNMMFEVTGINRNAVLKSVFEGKPTSFPKSKCFYKTDKSISTAELNSNSGTIVPVTTEFGLWNAYSQSVIRKVLHDVFRHSSVKTSKLSDDYNHKQQNLNRELAREYFEARIQQVYFEDNLLAVDLETIQ